jgi:spore coat protein H
MLLTSALLLALGIYAPPKKVPAPKSTPQVSLYQTTKIWNIHLTFTAEQWAAIEPKGGMFPGFGPPPGGGEGEDGKPPRLFGPAMFLSPAFMKDGDVDKDKKLSLTEFKTLGEKWFDAWDAKKMGALEEKAIRTGLNALAPLPPPPPPGGDDNDGPPGFSLQGPEGKRNGVAAMMGIEFNYVHANLDFEGKILKDVAVRYKGNGTFLTSRMSLKKSFKVDLNKYNKQNQISGVTTLNLHNAVTDASWMNEVLTYQLFRDANIPAPTTAYARVSITVPGKFNKHYVGLYSLVEDVSSSTFMKRNFGTDKGAIFKPVTPNMFAYLGEDWKKYKQTYDPKTDLTPAQQQRMIAFCKFVTQSDDATFAAQIGDYVDMDEFARYMATLVYAVDLDGILGPGQNFYLHLHPTTQKFQIIPWDHDQSFGQFGMRGTQEQREDLSIEKPWQDKVRFLERLFKVQSFRTPYKAYLAKYNQTLFQPARFASQVDAIGAAIRPAVKDEARANPPGRVAQFEDAVAGKVVTNNMGFFVETKKPIKLFTTLRSRSIAAQLTGKSTGKTLSPFGFGFGPPPPPPSKKGEKSEKPEENPFTPGMIFGPKFFSQIDTNADEKVTRDEFLRGFVMWFGFWDKEKLGAITEEQLQDGINEDLAPAPPG